MFAINNAGMVVGCYAVNHPGISNYVHGFDAMPAAIPEASTPVSLGLLPTLGLSGVVIAARKKAATTT